MFINAGTRVIFTFTPYVQIKLHIPVSSTSLVIDKKATDEEIICNMVTFLLYSINLLAPELFFLILAHPVYKM